MKTSIPSARDLMNRHVHTVTPDLPLIDLIDQLLKHEISCAPVVEKQESNDVLVGFVSESDALEHLSNDMFYGFAQPQPTVMGCMQRHPISVCQDVDVFAVASLLAAHRYRHIPVVGENNRLVGIVSRRDVLKAMRPFYFKAVKEHDREHFPPDLKKIMNHRFILSS